MNKQEFLDILKDYLIRDFSIDEVNDILRDYEEYFVDGLIEGKSDMEIISSLGSPKSIASDLINQIKENNGDSRSKNSNFSDSLNDKYNDIKIKSKEAFKKGKNYVSEKLTPNLEEENSTFSTNIIKIALKVLSLGLLIPAFIFIACMIPVGALLAGSVLMFIVGIPFVVNFVWSVPEVTSVVIFASILFVGCEIIAWQIFMLFIRLFKKLSKSYLNWLKTRNIYINASEKKEKLRREDDEYNREGEDDYE